ncbi:hypothetical protein A8C32_19405 [Flavivirga aquatica]|uniref:Putative auto-transporter adhesin head GIN domain-containing protein n=1 Tax=Flavivirga aquatica TaxID=1849968 RepID=A0A1E5T3S4_9FLAO|nr:hypothetical protein A8C32_19405 [Flavivirga aquatica]
MAQTLEKIKGNRNVITKQTNIESFHTIALDDDFKVELIHNNTPSIEIETDENLHEIIEFTVQDSILRLKKTLKITSKKALYIRVSYDNSLKNIQTTDNAEISSITSINLANIVLNTKGNSNAALTIKSDNFSYEASDKSKAKLNITSEHCSINQIGTTKLEALINSKQFAAILYQRANAIIEGSCDEGILEMDNNTTFNGKNFTMNTCNTICEINSDAYIEVLEKLTLNISGTSSIYIYENPQIIINKFTDTSKIEKKVKK